MKTEEEEDLMYACIYFFIRHMNSFLHNTLKTDCNGNIETENSLRDRSYCWRVLSDQVRVNNIVFANVGNIGIVFWVANDRPISAAS